MKRVKIKWIDSCGGDCYWLPLETFVPSVTYPETYGVVIFEDTEKISVAQSYAEGDKETPTQVNGVITIPKCSILELKEVD